MMKIDYFDGAEWFTLDVNTIKTWFNQELNWNNIQDVRECSNDSLEINYLNGKTVYFKNCYGTYGFPVTFK